MTALMMAPTDMTAQDTDEAEWLALESQHIRDPRSGYLIPRPLLTYGGKRATWTGIGCGKGKQHPKSYKIPGTSVGIGVRAKSPAQAEAMLIGTSASYLPPQLGPDEKTPHTFWNQKYNVKKNIWTQGGR